MSSTLHVYIGPCLKVWKRPEQTESDFYAQVDAYVTKTGDSFKRVLSGDNESQVFLIPDNCETRPNRVCEWQKNDSMEPAMIEISHKAEERLGLYHSLAGMGWPEFAYELVWGIVPYCC